MSIIMSHGKEQTEYLIDANWLLMEVVEVEDGATHKRKQNKVALVLLKVCFFSHHLI